MAQLLELEPKDILAASKYPQSVKARSLLCYCRVREFGMTTVELAKMLNLAQSTVSQSVIREQKIAEEQELNLLKQNNQ